MDLPDEFQKFSLYFHQDMDLFEKPIEHAIKAGLGGLTEKQKEVLKIFFSDLLKDNPSDDLLEKIWANSSSDFFFNAAGVRHIMTAVLKKL